MRLRRKRDSTATRLVIGIGHRDDGMARTKALGYRRGLIDRANHARVVHAATNLRMIVIKQGYDMPGFRFRKFAHEPCAGCTGTQDQHWFTFRCGQAVQTMLAPAAISEACATHQHDQQKRLQQQHKARPDKAVRSHQSEQHRSTRRRHECTQHDTSQISKACEAPQPLVETQANKCQRVNGDDECETSDDVKPGEVGRVNVEIEACPKQQRPRGS